jgi:hypothetical protein
MRMQLLPMMDAFFVGAPEKKSERDRRLNELNAIADSLKIMVRDIQSEQKLLEVRQSGIGNLPRDSRFSASQSIGQRQRDLTGLRRELEDLAEVVRNLLEKNGFLSSIQAGEKLNRLVENFLKGAENAQAIAEMGVPNGPAIMQAHDTGPASSIVPVIVFIYLGIKKLKERITGSQSDRKV